MLELGGNDPLIVMDDADLEEAASLAVAGSYKNSGQRCTAVKRMIVQEAVADRFVELLVEKSRRWQYGDPIDASMDMGTVIDEDAAKLFEARVNEAVAQGAQAPARQRTAAARCTRRRCSTMCARDDAGAARRPSARSRR